MSLLLNLENLNDRGFLLFSDPPRPLTIDSLFEP